MKNQIRISFLLIALFSMGCAKNNNHKISKIKEASGISYCSNSDTLVVANDEGSYYEISKSGEIITRKKLGDYDLEGVVCEDERIVFAVEDRGFLLLDRKTLKSKMIKLDTHFKGKKLPLFDKKNGIEGIAKVGDLYYLSKQSKKAKESFLVAVKLDRYHSKIVDMIKHKVVDSAGLEYHNNSLYIVSDKKNLLVRYDIEQQKIICKVELEKSAQEGITFDNDGYLYIADDEGSVFKYSAEYFGSKCNNKIEKR